MNTTKFYLTLFICLFITNSNILSQNEDYFNESDIDLQDDIEHKEHNPKNEEKRDSILIKKLNLSENEAGDFLPVYHEFKSKNKSLYEKLKKTKAEFQGNKNQIVKEDKDENDNEMLNDKEAEEILNQILEMEIEKSKLDYEYYNKFKDIIGAKRALKLFHLEKKHLKKHKMKKGEKGKDGEKKNKSGQNKVRKTKK